MSDTPSATPPEGVPESKGKRIMKRRPMRRVKRAYRPRTVEDAKDAGVQAADAPRAEAPRVDADMAGPITRQSLEDRQITTFDLPQHRKKPGWDYKWEVITVMGVRVDRSILRDSHKAGWRPEKASDWPELAEGLGPDDAIEEGGQMLMGRPLHLSHEAQVEAYNRAKQQERDRMQAAAGGHVVGGAEGLANVRGVEVGKPTLQVELAIGAPR